MFVVSAPKWCLESFNYRWLVSLKIKIQVYLIVKAGVILPLNIRMDIAETIKLCLPTKRTVNTDVWNSMLCQSWEQFVQFLHNNTLELSHPNLLKYFPFMLWLQKIQISCIQAKAYYLLLAQQKESLICNSELLLCTVLFAWT